MINLSLASDQLVNLPLINDFDTFKNQYKFPDFTVLTDLKSWNIAILIASIASMETLLSLEAADRLDPCKRISSPDRELIAQGIGNMLSGFLGGLPITQVIVRSSVNISFGARTKLSTILHGTLLLISALCLTKVLNMIPLASLASVLIVVGYKLAKPSLFLEMHKLGWEQLVPFIATIIGILTTDLLKGVTIGMLFGIFFTLRQSYYNSHTIGDVISNEDGQEIHHIVLAEQISFFTKPNLLVTLNNIPANTKIIIDGTHSKSIAYDVLQLIRDFKIMAKTKNIAVETIRIAI